MASQGDYGLFLPTTYLYDTDKQDTGELIRNLYRNTNSIILALNKKDTGIYALTEFVNGQTFFPNQTLGNQSAERQVFRKVINFGTLPNAGTTSVAHGIAPSTAFTFTRIYGVANDTTGQSYLPLPYASPTAASTIELNVDATNVNITTGSNRTAYTITYVVLEYIKY